MANSPETVHRRWHTLIMAMFGAACIDGCSVMQPIEVLSAERLFIPDPKIPDPSDSACKSSDTYAKGLGTELCRTDSLRLKWMHEAAQVSNNAVNLNALSWPLAGAALYYHLKVSDSTLLLPATMAAGLYGFFNSGIPGRDTIDRQAAKKLACAMIDASADLYSSEEFAKLHSALRRLDWAIQGIERKQGTLVDDLRVSGSGSGTFAPDSIQRLIGKTPRGSGATDPRPALERYLTGRLVWARQIRANGDSLTWEVSSRAERLRALRTQVALERHTALAEKAPALRNPTEASKDVALLVTGFQAGANLLAAQSGQKERGAGDATKKGAPKADPELSTVPSQLVHPLKSSSIKAWREFEYTQNQMLQAAVLQVRAWTDEHEWRQTRTRETGLKIGCISQNSLPTVPNGVSNARRSALPTSSEPISGTPLPSQGDQP